MCVTVIKLPSPSYSSFLGNRFFYFLFYRFFSQEVSVGERNKNKNHSDHFPIELKSKVPSILIQLEKGQNEFYFTN